MKTEETLREDLNWAMKRKRPCSKMAPRGNKYRLWSEKGRAWKDPRDQRDNWMRADDIYHHVPEY
eukprot:291032-Pelagomonas_calceolata.AAC.1